ncbi:ATP-binding protein (plasmid) [Streptomyces sp. BI20]|uniref:ATP-binding protein n=1 Tax=Streptomyces sp. BI20 TaxID=3403460 RepID=UPI003C76CA57
MTGAGPARWWRSLRWRVAVLIAVAVCAVAAAIGVLVHETTEAHALGQARDNAQRQLDLSLTTYLATGEAHGSGAELDSPILPSALRALVTSGHAGTAYDTGRQGPAVFAARPVGGHVLSVEIDFRGDLRSLARLDASMGLAGLLAVAAVLPPAVLHADRLGRRLRHAAGTARRIADGDLDARIDTPDRPGDEIAEISTAVDSMAGSLQHRLDAEQRFTADVAHELRTPLTGLITAAELLPDSETSGHVRERAGTLHALVEELLEVSRLDSGTERPQYAPCPLEPLVRSILRRTGHEVELRVHDPAVVETDPRRLERVLANLVSNAHRHGRGPVEVRIEDRTVSVRDRGPGFPATLTAEGPRRFRTGTPDRGGGHGLGLTIATGQAAVIGARLEFANPPEGGALALLHLP